ncbi:HEAT repeat domain-containing protein [bacterium]|nr:HEAT repeat domain-containing protein [bacterium]
MKYTSILKNKFFLILSILLLTTPLLAQDEDAVTIKEKSKETLQDEILEGGSQELVPREVYIGFPCVEIPKAMNNQKLLLPLLRNGNPWIRAEAAKALGEMGDQETVSYLSKILKKDKNPYVRYRAAWALGEIGGKESFATLKKALKREEDWQVKGMIEKGIKEIESGHSISSGVKYQNFLRRKR